MTIEMTTTALGTNIARVRGANMDKISAATRRSVLGTTDWAGMREGIERAAESFGISGVVDGDTGEDLLDMVPVEPAKPYRGPAATERQVAFILKLQDERGVTVDYAAEDLTKAEASREIERLLALPRAPRAPQVPAGQPAPAKGLEDGVYVKDGSVFMVKHAIHGSGQQYASKLQAAPELGQSGTWVYVGRAPLKDLTEADRLTREMAQAYGEVYGCCVRCGRALTDAESIARSIGRTCWGKF